MDVKLTPGQTPSGEGVLANFFNSLLHKKSSPGIPSGPNSLSSGANSLTPRTNGNVDDMMTPEKEAMRVDNAAELDRIVKSVKKDLDFEPPVSEC